MTNDIAAADQTPAFAGAFASVILAAAQAEKARHLLPKWTGAHCRVLGNYPVAEVTPHGTLLLTNEVTLPDLAHFVDWLRKVGDIKLVALMPCGHPPTHVQPEQHGIVLRRADITNLDAPGCQICAAAERAAGVERELRQANARLNEEYQRADKAEAASGKLATELARERESQSAQIRHLQETIDAMKPKKRLRRKKIRGKGSKPVR